jgi:GT2 family glycosyltransferase
VSAEPTRPSASVIVPFAGDAQAAERALGLLARIELGPGDEAILADNSRELMALRLSAPKGVRVVEAGRERSSYHARNAGAAAATGEWLVFIDSDCRPEPDLLRRYFEPPPAAAVGALAGSVIGAPGQDAFLARYARSRNFLDQDSGLHTHDDAAATANLAVRRAAFDEIAGFEEGIRSGGDVDLCRRLQAGGWTLERRAEARVEHLHRESLVDLLGTIARYSAGARWLNERYPGSAPAWPLVPGLIGAGTDIASDAARGRIESAAFRGVDALGLLAHVAGYRFSNRVGPEPPAS